MENLKKDSRYIRTEIPVKKIGDSYYIRMGKDIRQILDISNGVILGVKLWNMETEEIICPECQHSFVDYTNVDPYDCPLCGNEFLNIDTKEVIAVNE
tara:strand:+ start:206 stop:496 length:291 start_codon:yes stop_codon:yes gene_type:complete